jgi:hypothetical protein
MPQIAQICHLFQHKKNSTTIGFFIKRQRMEVEKGKGGFILQQLIEWTKNSSNLID